MSSAMRVMLLVSVSALAFLRSDRAISQGVDCRKIAECAQRLVQIANKLTDENRVLLRRIEALEGSMSSVQRGVVAFDLDTCPLGWEPFVPVQGRFIRALDPNDRSRNRGSVQDDALQGHSFGDGNYKRFRYSPTHTTNDPANGYSEMQSTGIFGQNPAFGLTIDVQIVSDGTNGTPRIANETRPKNIALLFCVRK